MNKVVKLADFKRHKASITQVDDDDDLTFAYDDMTRAELMDLEGGIPPHRLNPLVVDVAMIADLLPTATKEQLKLIGDLSFNLGFSTEEDMYAVTRAAVDCEIDIECEICPFKEECGQWNALEAASIINVLQNSKVVEEDDGSKNKG